MAARVMFAIVCCYVMVASSVCGHDERWATFKFIIGFKIQVQVRVGDLKFMFQIH